MDEILKPGRVADISATRLAEEAYKENQGDMPYAGAHLHLFWERFQPMMEDLVGVCDLKRVKQIKSGLVHRIFFKGQLRDTQVYVEIPQTEQTGVPIRNTEKIDRKYRSGRKVPYGIHIWLEPEGQQAEHVKRSITDVLYEHLEQ